MMLTSSSRVHEMQMRNCFPLNGGYDTFSDLKGADRLQSLEDVAEAVLGSILVQERYISYTHVGKMTIDSGQLGNSWGKSVKFANHPEVWNLRSSPRGRLNQELLPGELREIVILKRPNPLATTSTITHIRIWLHVPDVPSRIRQSASRGELTHGAVAVPMTGIHLFPFQGSAVLKRLNNCGGRDDFYCLLSSFTSIKRRPTKREEEALGIEGHHQYVITDSVHASSVPVAALAAHLVGTTITEKQSKRPGIEDVSKEEYLRVNMETQTALHANLVERQFLGRSPNSVINAYVTKIISDAEDVLDQGTFAGMLDLYANDTLTTGALPDDLTHPSRLPLLIVASVRIALSPETYSQPPFKGDDLYAAGLPGCQ